MIRLEKVSKQFGERLLFSDISIEFKAGKTYALIGLSGSGKTTLLNMLAKLESYEGQIIYRGKNLKQYKTSDFFRKELGYLFQNFGLLENQTIDENLRLGLIGQKLKKDERQKRELEALKNVGLDYLDLGKRIFELSGGEAQRVALAKIILKNPPLILADEATAALDPETSKDIMTRLIALKNDHRVIVIATHNPIIWEMADKVISIHDL